MDTSKIKSYDKFCLGSKSYFHFTDEFINQETKTESAA